MQRRGPNSEAQGGLLRGGGVQPSWKTQDSNPSFEAVLQLFVLKPNKIMALYTFGKTGNSSVSRPMLKVDYLSAFLYLCYLELCSAEIGIRAFIRFPVAFKASSWLEWVSASCFFVYLIIHLIIFILLLVVLVARLGNMGKSRLCFWCPQLWGNTTYCFRPLPRARRENVEIIADPCPPRRPSQGSRCKVGCHTEVLCGRGRKFLNLHLFIFSYP